MGGIVSGFFGSSTPSAPNIQVWQPQYTNQADTQAYNSITGINNNNPYAALNPQYTSVLNAQLTNPYAAGAQTAANTSGSQLATTGANTFNAGNALNTGAMSLLPYISTVANTALDPQSALYNQTKQNVLDQANVSNANAGLSNSPYGAGVTNQANTNFNIDWNATRLNNQIAGLNAAGQGINQAGAGLTTASNLGTGGAAATLGSGAIPLTAYNNNLANLQAALNNYSGAGVAGNQNTQMAVQDLLAYLGLGAQQSNAQAQATQTSYQNQLAAANSTNQGISSLVNNLISGLGSFGSGFSSAFNGAQGANTLASLGATSSTPMSDAEWATFLMAA